MCELCNWITDHFFKKKKEEPMTLQGADYWDNKWPKNKVTYRARGRYSMDIRNLILNRSYILDTVVAAKSKKNAQGNNYDEMAKALLNFVIDHMTYKSDDSVYDKPEFWQHPEITLAMGIGDCEDGALLLASLMRVAGIPAYRVKLCAGWVKSSGGQEGHAYVIYLADDNKWYTLDWCYWPSDSINNYKRNPHEGNKNYKDIWWTANDENSWAQNSVQI
jgi:hypothetical protein